MGFGPKAYRPDIDGLRAIAILLVVFGHAFPQRVPGGFIGVDVFFVISGYLITGIIHGEIADGSFSVRRFYARRIRRIFPALIVVLAASLVAGYFLLLPGEMIALGREVIGGAGFAANLLFYSDIGYFDAAAHTKPLLHLWSLGIEEQFYLAWPLLLLGLLRWRLSIPLGVGGVLVLSFVANVVTIWSHPDAAFYLPFTRAWELAAGALLAIRSPELGDRAKNILASTALAMLVVATAFYSARMTYPGIAASVPVIAAAALIVAQGSLPNRIILSNRAAVRIGLISYPLYLWHWPILVFSETIKGGLLSPRDLAIAVLSSFLLAHLTYRFVEAPIRFGLKRPVPALAGSMLVVASLAALALPDGLSFRLPTIIREAAAMTVSTEFMRFGQCQISASANPAFDKSCVDAKRPLVFVWGDSTAGMLAAGLRQIQGDRFGLAQFTLNSCPPLLTKPEIVPFCIETNRRIVAEVATSHPDVVIIHTIWNDFPTREMVLPTIAALRDAGARRIIWLGPVPIWQNTLPHLVVQYYRNHRTLIPERSESVGFTLETDEKIGRVIADLGVEYLSAFEELCNRDGCLTRMGDKSGDLTSADAVHLLPHASRYLASKLIDRILAGGP
jgi:peptidoglycan/LPS O-acetylase OafA/YrhL